MPNVCSALGCKNSNEKVKKALTLGKKIAIAWPPFCGGEKIRARILYLLQFSIIIDISCWGILRCDLFLQNMMLLNQNISMRNVRHISRN